MATISIIVFNIICFVYGIPPCKAFRHISFAHIHSNMAYLLVFGGYVESKVGWKRFAVCYLLSGLGGHILWSMMDGRPTAGSSSAVWGIIGMYLCIYRYPEDRTTTEEPIGLYFHLFNKIWYGVIGKWMMACGFLYDLYRAIYHADNSAAYWAHIGGFLTGAIFGMCINCNIGAGAAAYMKIRMRTLASLRKSLGILSHFV